MISNAALRALVSWCTSCFEPLPSTATPGAVTDRLQVAADVLSNAVRRLDHDEHIAFVALVSGVERALDVRMVCSGCRAPLSASVMVIAIADNQPEAAVAAASELMMFLERLTCSRLTMFSPQVELSR